MALNLAALALTVHVVAAPGLEREAARLAPIAERDLARIEADLDGMPRVDDVEVRLVKHMEDIADAAPAGRGAPPWAIGTAYPEDGVVVVAMRGRDGALLDDRQTLDHELAHMALGKAIGNENVPRWLTEGFAYMHSSDFSIERGATLFGAVFTNHLVPIEALDASFPAAETEAGLAYAESYDFTAFLAERGRWDDGRDRGDREPFRRFLKELSLGRGVEGAAEDAFGRRLVDLETEWRESVRSRYLWYPLSLAGALVWVLGGFLLFLGWWRRKRQNRRRMQELAIEDALEDAAGEEYLH